MEPMSDTIRFACPSCGHGLKIASVNAGRRARCPSCDDTLTVPYVDVAAPVTSHVVAQVADYARSGTKYCHHCGGVIASLAEICPKCGVRQPDIGDSGPRHSSDRDIHRVTAALFAIFLGPLGAHKFYLGQTGMGVFYLVVNVLLCWTLIVPVVFYIVTIIEGVTYLSHSDKDFARKFGPPR